MSQFLSARLGLAAAFLIYVSSAATGGQPSWEDAVAVWHFSNLGDAAGPNSALTVHYHRPARLSVRTEYGQRRRAWRVERRG
jgi:hypothetical protein